MLTHVIQGISTYPVLKAYKMEDHHINLDDLSTSLLILQCVFSVGGVWP